MKKIRKIKKRVVKREDMRGLYIPAGLFLGMGIGFLIGELVAGLFIGIGIGFFLTAISKIKRR